MRVAGVWSLILNYKYLFFVFIVYTAWKMAHSKNIFKKKTYSMLLKV